MQKDFYIGGIIGVLFVIYVAFFARGSDILTKFLIAFVITLVILLIVKSTIKKKK